MILLAADYCNVLNFMVSFTIIKCFFKASGKTFIFSRDLNVHDFLKKVYEKCKIECRFFKGVIFNLKIRNSYF